MGSLTKRCLRIWLLVYSVLIAVFGVALLIFDAAILYKLVEHDEFVSGQSVGSTATLVVTGFALVVLAKFGWSVAYKQNRVHALVITIVFCILALCHVAIIVWILTVLHKLKDVVTVRVEKAFHSASVDKDPKFVKIWDSVQYDLSCCGVGGPTDYRSSKTVPWSCCRRSQDPTATGDCSSVHQHGCMLNLYDVTYDRLSYAACSSAVACLLEILGAVGFFYLTKALRSSSSASEDPQRRSSSGNRASGSHARDSTTRGLLAHMRPQKY